MLRRFAAVGAGGVLALMSYSVMVVAPASAGGPILPNKVKVTKVVVGDSKGAGFQVVVTCEQKKSPASVDANGGFIHTETLTFGPQGGTETAKAPLNSTCTIVETHDGGASKVDVSPPTCDFTIAIDEVSPDIVGKTCDVTVTNTFVPEEEQAGPAGPQGPPGPPGESAVQAATAVVATARFTG